MTTISVTVYREYNTEMLGYCQAAGEFLRIISAPDNAEISRATLGAHGTPYDYALAAFKGLIHLLLDNEEQERDLYQKWLTTGESVRYTLVLMLEEETGR